MVGFLFSKVAEERAVRVTVKVRAHSNCAAGAIAGFTAFVGNDVLYFPCHANAFL